MILWCYFGSHIGSFVCKEQRFIQITSYRESYKNKENRNLSQSSRKARKNIWSNQEWETLNSGALWQLECNLWESMQLWSDFRSFSPAWLHLLGQHPVSTCWGVLWCFHFCLYCQQAPSQHVTGSNPTPGEDWVVWVSVLLKGWTLRSCYLRSFWMP